MLGVGELMLSLMARSLLARSSQSGGHLTGSDNKPPNVKKTKKIRRTLFPPTEFGAETNEQRTV